MLDQICAYRPELKDLYFRQQLLADEETMSYNEAWGGIVPFPEEKWEAWYRAWLEPPEDLRWYRYIYDTEKTIFVGEIAYHLDAEREVYLCDVVVKAEYRGNGYGTAGIGLICEAAAKNGITELYDDIAADNPSLELFLKQGFGICRRGDTAVTVKKILRPDL